MSGWVVADKVTIVNPPFQLGTLHRATAREPIVEGTFEYLASAGFTGWRRYADEGLTWCRGWEGEAVEALKAAVALTRVPGGLSGVTGPTGTVGMPSRGLPP